MGLVTATFHISEHVCEKVGLVTAMMFHVSEHVWESGTGYRYVSCICAKCVRL